MFYSDEVTSESCLIDGLEESFDLHFTRSSINHLSPDLKKKENKKHTQSRSFKSEDVRKRNKKSHVGPLLGSAHRLEAGCPSGATVVHWPSSNIEHELSNESKKCLKTRAARSTSMSCSPPLYCCPPPLHPESPVSQVREGSLAIQRHQTRVLNR